MRNINKCKSLLLTSFFLTMLSSCKEKESIDLWIVEKEMPVYETHIDDIQNVIATLQVGDVCAPGVIRVEKMFQYTEVLCSTNVHGWVADDFFQKIQK